MTTLWYKSRAAKLTAAGLAGVLASGFSSYGLFLLRLWIARSAMADGSNSSEYVAFTAGIIITQLVPTAIAALVTGFLLRFLKNPRPFGSALAAHAAAQGMASAASYGLLMIGMVNIGLPYILIFLIVFAAIFMATGLLVGAIKNNRRAYAVVAVVVMAAAVLQMLPFIRHWISFS